MLIVIPLAVALIVVLVVFIRGWRRVEVPACPSCKYHVVHLADPTCPECGQDLLASGVLATPIQPAPRWARALLVVALATLLLGGAIDLLERPFARFSERLFGTDVKFMGEEVAWIKLAGDASEVDLIQVQYPVPGTPEETAPAASSASPEFWTFPQSVGVTISFHNEESIDLRLIPYQRGDELLPSTASWSLEEDGKPIVFDSGGEAGVHDVGGRVTFEAYASRDLGALVAAWTRSNRTYKDAWDPGVFILQRMVDAMMQDVTLGTDNYRMHMVLGESARASVGGGTSGTVSKVTGLKVRGPTLVMVIWCAIWLVLLAIAVAPGQRVGVFGQAVDKR